ncbi:MAG: aldo/keto reductase [Gemmataceae bacterium]
MEKRIFGKTGLEVSVLGFGGAPIGFLKTEQEAVSRILNLMLDSGVNLIDSAAMYLGSEELIGKAVGQRRNDFVFVSKCGQGANGVNEVDWSEAGIARYIEQTLRRTGFEYVDVMLLHTCDLATLKQGEALGALEKAKRAGTIRFLGYSGDNEAVAHAVTLPSVDVVQMSINLCDQANIDLALPAARAKNVGVMAKRPIANAAWKKPSDQPGMYASYARTYTERLAAMDIRPGDFGIAGPAEEAWPELALRFTLSQPGAHTAIIGTTKAENVKRNLAAAAKGPLPHIAVDSVREAFRRAEAAAGQAWRGQT